MKNDYSSGKNNSFLVFSSMKKKFTCETRVNETFWEGKCFGGKKLKKNFFFSSWWNFFIVWNQMKKKNHKNVPDIFLLMCEMDKRFEGEKISWFNVSSLFHTWKKQVERKNIPDFLASELKCCNALLPQSSCAELFVGQTLSSELNLDSGPADVPQLPALRGNRWHKHVSTLMIVSLQNSWTCESVH